MATQLSGQRGALIVVEGLDRAGKSSQCEALRDVLQKSGHTVKYIRFPDRTTAIGKMIDSYLRGQSQMDDHSIHLLFSANRWEVAQSIERDVDNGTTVIVDRYSYSGAVYSAAKGNPSLSLGGDVTVIDAGRSFQDVAQDMRKAVEDRIACLGRIGPLRKLGPIAV
ncbi:dTMP kinase [Aspergillus terreus]